MALLIRRGTLEFSKLRQPLSEFNVGRKIEKKNVKSPPKVFLGKVSEERKKMILEMLKSGTTNKENLKVGKKEKKLSLLKVEKSEPEVKGKPKGKGKKKDLKEDTKGFNEFDDRYFCLSCRCHVDASRRRHDQSVHKPPRMATIGKSPSPVKADGVPKVFTCDVCEKELKSEKGLEMHKSKAHSDTPKTMTVKAPVVKKLKPKLSCPDCNELIPRKRFVQHMVEHDKKANKPDTVNMLSPAPAKGNTFRSIISFRLEFYRRQFLYRDPKDPRWNGEDAILQCRHCPSKMFMSWYKYEKHVKKWHPYVPGSDVGKQETEKGI